jgi:hypothetical protein
LLDAGHHGEYQVAGELRHSSSLALTQLLLTYHVLRMYRNVVDVPFAPAVAALERLNMVRPASSEQAVRRGVASIAERP